MCTTRKPRGCQWIFPVHMHASLCIHCLHTALLPLYSTSEQQLQNTSLTSIAHIEKACSPVVWLLLKDLSFLYRNMFRKFLEGLSCLLSHPIKKNEGKWNDDWFDQFVVHRVTEKKDLKRGTWDAPLVKPPTWNHLRTQINGCHLASGQTTLPLSTHPVPVICFLW